MPTSDNWCEAHEGLRDHGKTIRAARILGVPRMQVVGHLMGLWWWAMTHAPDGDLTNFDAYDIAGEGAEYVPPNPPKITPVNQKRAEKFVQALTDCRMPNKQYGFLERHDDGRLLIHDWDVYAGKLFVTREKEAARKRAEREAAAQARADKKAAELAAKQGDHRPSAGHPPDVRQPSECREEKNTIDNSTEQHQDARERPPTTTAPKPVVVASSTSSLQSKPGGMQAAGAIAAQVLALPGAQAILDGLLGLGVDHSVARLLVAEKPGRCKAWLDAKPFWITKDGKPRDNPAGYIRDAIMSDPAWGIPVAAQKAEAARERKEADKATMAARNATLAQERDAAAASVEAEAARNALDAAFLALPADVQEKIEQEAMAGVIREPGPSSAQAERRLLAIRIRELTERHLQEGAK